MKKKFFVPAAIAALMGVAGFLGHSASTPDDGLSDLQLANAEALAQDEGKNPCDNFNGYRRILEGNERIYDCCYQEKIGRGKDDCKRW